MNQAMAHLIWNVRRLLDWLGWRVWCALFLLAGAAVLWRWQLLPAQQQFQDVQQSLARFQSNKVGSLSPEAGPAQRLQAFYTGLPHSAGLQDALLKLYQTAEKQQLQALHVEYQIQAKEDSKLQTCKLMMPLKASYPALRRFLAQILQDNPALALEKIAFSRQKAEDAALEVELHLTLYMLKE